MTYNFDPDRWFEIQLRLLDHRLDSGEIDACEYRIEREDLGRRHDEMQQRLDGTYAIRTEGHDAEVEKG